MDVQGADSSAVDPEGLTVATSASVPLASVPKRCVAIGCDRLLTGKQKKFCSRPCYSRQWDHDRPRLGTPPMLPDGRSLDRIVALCSDRRWRTIPEIAHDAASRELTVARRIQETGGKTRKGRKPTHLPWQSRTRAHSKTKEYRLALNPEPAA